VKENAARLISGVRGFLFLSPLSLSSGDLFLRSRLSLCFTLFLM